MFAACACVRACVREREKASYCLADTECDNTKYLYLTRITIFASILLSLSTISFFRSYGYGGGGDYYESTQYICAFVLVRNHESLQIYLL